jgi:hypothetical protein
VCQRLKSNRVVTSYDWDCVSTADGEPVLRMLVGKCVHAKCCWEQSNKWNEVHSNEKRFYTIKGTRLQIRHAINDWTVKRRCHASEPLTTNRMAIGRSECSRVVHIGAAIVHGTMRGTTLRMHCRRSTCMHQQPASLSAHGRTSLRATAVAFGPAQYVLSRTQGGRGLHLLSRASTPYNCA